MKRKYTLSERRQLEAKHSLNATKAMTHDLAKDVKAYQSKHLDDLRVIQSNIDIETKRPMGRFESKQERKKDDKTIIKPLVQIIKSFISKGYSSNDTEDIIKALGFEIGSYWIDLVKEGVGESLQQQAKQQSKQTKRQEVKQYPPRYTTSKPQPIVDITSTDRPKLNLSHIQQVHQPQSVSPSENTRKPKLSVSSSVHQSRENKLDYSFGAISGIEADNRIFNSELKKYRKALTRLQESNLISQLPQRTGIHATNDARAAVRGLVPGRLTSWR